MKNKLMIALALLTLSAASLLTAQAQNNREMSVPKNPKVNAVYIKCTPNHGGDVASSLTLTNTSGKTIAANQKIFIKNPAGSTFQSYAQPFAPNTSRDASGPAGNAGPTCQAWFLQ